MRPNHVLCIFWMVLCIRAGTAQLQWTTVTPPPTTAALRGIAWTGSRLVAVGDKGAVVTSENAATWTARQSGVATTLRAVTCIDGTVYAVGDSGTVLTSPDGSAWVAVASGTTQALYGLVKAGGLIVAVGVGTSLTTTDGAAWVAGDIGTTDTLTSVAWTGAALVAVGYNSTILSSSNGTGWEPRHSGYLDWMYGVAFCRNRLLVVGYNYSAYNCYATVLAETSGGRWTRAYAGSTVGALYAIDASDSLFVTAGFGGTILVSTDADTWQPCTSGTTRKLMGLTHTPTHFVAVGDRGTIVTWPYAALSSSPRTAGLGSRRHAPVVAGARFTRNRVAVCRQTPDSGPVQARLADLSGRLQPLHPRNTNPPTREKTAPMQGPSK